jgi:transcription elongation factor SPT5
VEHSGIIVVRTTNVVTVSAKGGRATGPDLTKINPAIMLNGTNPGAMGPPRSVGRDRLLGKTVSVRRGPYKGLLGIVKDTTDDTARVELHTKSKIVTIPKDFLLVKEYVFGTRSTAASD